MSEVVTMSDMAWIGNFVRRYMGEKTLREWEHNNWQSQLGYTPNSLKMMNGKLGAIFICRDDARYMLSEFWSWGNQVMKLKRLTPFLTRGGRKYSRGPYGYSFWCFL